MQLPEREKRADEVADFGKRPDRPRPRVSFMRKAVEVPELAREERTCPALTID